MAPRQESPQSPQGHGRRGSKAVRDALDAERKFELQKLLARGKAVAKHNRELIEEADPRMTRNRFLLAYVGPGLLMVLATGLIMIAALFAQRLGIDLKAMLGSLGLAFASVLGGAWARSRFGASRPGSSLPGADRPGPDRPGQSPPENKPPPDDQN